jgi:hypothetical protein
LDYQDQQNGECRRFKCKQQNNDDKKWKYDFGFINNGCRWKFIEDKEKNECIVDAFMNNFDMENWLKYNKLHYEQAERKMI